MKILIVLVVVIVAVSGAKISDLRTDGELKHSKNVKDTANLIISNAKASEAAKETDKRDWKYTESSLLDQIYGGAYVAGSANNGGIDWLAHYNYNNDDDDYYYIPWWYYYYYDNTEQNNMKAPRKGTNKPEKETKTDKMV